MGLSQKRRKREGGRTESFGNVGVNLSHSVNHGNRTQRKEKALVGTENSFTKWPLTRSART